MSSASARRLALLLALALAAPAAWAGGGRVELRGRQALAEAELRQAAARELAAFEARGARTDADDAAFALEAAYRRAGFAHAAVEYRLEPAAEATLAVFEVREGPRVVLGSLRLEGREALAEDEALAFFAPADRGFLGGGGRWFVEAEFRSAVSALANFYYLQGFQEVRVEGPEVAFTEDGARAEVTVRVNEGLRYRVVGVELPADLLPEVRPALEAAAAEVVGKPYFPRRKLVLRSRAAEAFADLGYPDARVEVAETPGAAPGDVALQVAAESGPQVRVTGVDVLGATKTDPEFIRRRLTLAPGDLYRLEERRRSFRALYRTGLFTVVDLELAPGAEPERRLVVRVEEAPSRELFLEPGWGSYELLRLTAGYRDRNLRGTGRVFKAEGGYSALARSLGVNLTDPWFLNTQVTASAPLTYRHRVEPSFTREETGLGVSFSRELGSSVAATLGYGYRVTALTQVTADEGSGRGDTGYNLASLKAQVTADTRDDLFFPSRGYKTYAGAELADRLLGGDLGFLRLTAGARGYWPLGGSTVLALRYDTGFVVPGQREVTLPLSERLFNGGEGTVRSFRESELGPVDADSDPTGGYGFNVAGLEVRRRLFGSVAGTVFFDYGNVSPTRSRAEAGLPPFQSRSEVLRAARRDFFRDFRSGVGAGLLYLLPVGPARLDAAVNPSPRVDRGEDRLVFHFSVGLAF
ncbi:MAG: BamA/OMP85 family outer membrane protein [Deferrisomatales bacterium]